MAGSINKVVLIGNLGRDPEIRMSSSGQKIAHLSVATSDTWKDKLGERQEKTEWHRVVIFNSNLSDFVEKYVKKGSKVYLEGSLQTRKYTDSTGQEKYITEVIIGSFRGELIILDGRTTSDVGISMDSSETNGWDTGSQAQTDAFDDEIPF